MGDEITFGMKVDCYSGFTYAERPVAIFNEHTRLEVNKIEAEWIFPTGKSFIVFTLDGRRFKLTYIDYEDSWQVIPI
jgi:hypothetical protein